MSHDPVWITAIAGSVGACSLLVIIWQVKANHDKSRREKALDILEQWDKIRTPNAFRYEQLMFSLSSPDVEKIEKGQSIEINKELAEKHLPDLQENKDGKYIIPVHMVLEIRSTLLTLLNTIENVALAYKHQVADREILDDAYYHILIEKDFLRKCGDFMEHFGAGAWPSVTELPKLMKPPKSRSKTA